MRVGIDVSTSAVNSSSSYVEFYWKIYTQNQYRYANTGLRLAWSGADSGSLTFNNTSGSGAVTLRATMTTRYTYTSSGGSPGTRYLSASVSNTYNGVTPGATRTVTIPARPTGIPNAPTIGNAVYSSDSQTTLSWTNNASPNGYTSITVQALVNGTGGWKTVATLSGAPTSFVDRTSRPNQRVQYRVRANNGSGSSPWSGSSPFFYTTPAPPSNVSVSLGSGGLAQLTWQNNVGWVDGTGQVGYTTVIQKSTNSGSTWTTVNAGRGAAFSDWTDSTALTGLTRYRLATKAENRSPNTGPQSAWVTSSDISVAIPPLAPTNLVPSDVMDPGLATSFYWTYRPGADGALQNNYELQWSADSGSTWTSTGKLFGISWPSPSYPGADPGKLYGSHVLPAGTLPNNTTILWQVRTWGYHADPGPWSASQAVDTSTTPAVNITSPTDPVQMLPVTVTWDYSQPDDLPQVSWAVQVFDSEGSPITSNAEHGDASSYLPQVPFLNGRTYTILVSARSSAGLQATDEITFTVDLIPPANVQMTPVFNADSGTVSIGLNADNPQDGVTAGVVSVDIQRSINGGDWITIIAGVPITEDSPTSVVDLLPSLNGTNTYRVVAMSVAPSQSVQDPLDVPVNGFSDCEWAFVNWGDDLTTVERGKCEPSLSQALTRKKEMHAASGRRWPMALIGDSRSSVTSVSLTIETGDQSDCPVIVDWEPGEFPGDPWSPVYGTLVRSSPPREWSLMALDATHVVYRDWTGRREYGVVEEVTVAEKPDTTALATVSFTVTRTYWVEGVDPTPPPDAQGDSEVGA